MEEAKYESAKEKAKAKVEKVVAVSLTSDMWTSINMDTYLAVTCHFVGEKIRLSSSSVVGNAGIPPITHC